MRISRLALGGLALATAVAGLAVAGSPASAAVTGTAITSVTGGPGGTYPLADVGVPTPPLVISGTSTGGVANDLVQVRCYERDGDWAILADKVPVGADGRWSVQASVAQQLRHRCQLVATTSAYVGNLSVAAAAGFVPGPFLSIGTHGIGGTSGGKGGETVLYTDYLSVIGSVADVEVESPSWCGPYISLVSPSGPPTQNDYLWDCAASLYDEDNNYDGNPAATNGPIVIGGHNAYTPGGIADFNEDLLYVLPAGGSAFSLAYDPATGNGVRTEVEPLYFCLTVDLTAFVDETYPGSDCKAVQYSGVTLTRAVAVSHGGAVVAVNDTFSNAGASTQVKLEYEHDLAYSPTSTPTPEYKAPGATTYSTPALASAVDTSAWPAIGSLYAHDDKTVPGGSVLRPLGAMTYSTKPTSAFWHSPTELFFNYTRTVPANGSLSLSHTFATAADAATVASLAALDEANVKPVVTVNAIPAKVGTKALTVTGKVAAGGNGPVASVTVAAGASHVTVPVVNGAFSAPLTLTAGANAISVLATDPVGNVGTASASTTFADPASGGTPKVTRTKVNGKVTKLVLSDKVSCASFAPATGCKGAVVVKSGSATIGSVAYKLAAGASTTVKVAFGSGIVKKVNALKKGKHLDTKLTITYADPAGGSLATKARAVRLL